MCRARVTTQMVLLCTIFVYAFATLATLVGVEAQTGAPTFPPFPTSAPSTSPIPHNALLNVPYVYFYPINFLLDPTLASRRAVDAACTHNAPNHGDYYSFPSLGCEKAFAFLGFTTDNIVSYSAAIVYGTVPQLPFNPSARVLDRYSQLVAANWSMLWNNHTLNESLGVYLPVQTNYGLGIFSNGSLAPNCNNWNVGLGNPGNTSTNQIVTSLTSRFLTTNALDVRCNSTTIAFFCVCVPPGLPTVSPTRAPTVKTSTLAPSLPTKSPTLVPTPPTTLTGTPTTTPPNVSVALGLGLGLGLGIPLVFVFVTCAWVRHTSRGWRVHPEYRPL